MKSKKIFRNAYLAVITGALCVTAMSVKAGATGFYDANGHWARAEINKASEIGYVSGYADGSFKPDRVVTRAEFIKMINNALKITNSAEIYFSDVNSSDWYFGEVKKAVASGYISGYSDNTFAAGKNVTRQEAAVIMSRIVTAPEWTSSLKGFSDYKSIPEWAEGAIKTMYSKGYMVGDANKKFNPSDVLTRAQAVKIINSVLNNESIVSSDYELSQSNYTQSKVIYSNNFTITDRTASGTINLDNCRILGTINVDCVNDNTVVLKNTGASNLNISRGTKSVSVTLSGNSTVTNTKISRAAILRGDGFVNIDMEGAYLSGKTVKISSDVEKIGVFSDAAIELSGDISNLNVNSGVTLSVSGGRIANLNVAKTATNAKITLSSSTKVGRADIKAKTAFKGSGTIDEAIESANGITYDKKPSSVKQYGEQTGSTFMASFNPSNNSRNVGIYEDIKISFLRAAYKANGSTLTSSYIENDAIELRKGSVTGKNINFSAAVSTNKKDITIIPDEYLESDTTYYIILNEGKFADSAGVKNQEQTASFVTAEKQALMPVITPANNKSGVQTDSELTIKFDTKIFKKSGDEINAGYIQNSVIELRKGSLTGSKIDFTPTVNSARTLITVTPDKKLESKTTYYLIINNASLSDEDGNYNSKTVSKFTTSMAITTSPSDGDDEVELNEPVVINFGSEICKADGTTIKKEFLEDIIKVKRSYSSESFKASINSSKKSITITPSSSWTAGKKYTVTIPKGNFIYLDEEYGEIGEISFTFNTVSGKISLLYFGVDDVGIDYAQATVRADMAGTAYLTLKPERGDSVTQTVSLSKNSQKDVLFDNLESNTKYTMSVYVVSNYDQSTKTLSETFTTKRTEVGITATDIDYTSAKISISYNAAGKLNVSYCEKGSNNFSALMTNFESSAKGSKSIGVADLTSGKTYVVKAEFTARNGETAEKTFEFTTDSQMVDTTLSSVKIAVSGGNYSADSEGNNNYSASVTVDEGESIFIIPEATGGRRAKITVNGEQVASGSRSGKIVITKSGKLTINITVTAENGKSEDYVLTVNVRLNEIK